MKRQALAITGALMLAGLATAPLARAQTGVASLARGEQVYARCLACHALAYDRVGPRHCGLFGRRAGTVPGFAYSLAMKQAGITWDTRTLDRFLAEPTKVIPGTTMTYDGVPDQHQRAELIAYLRQVDQTPACRTR
ncbi:c-type cytochrome [Ideonella sp.]|uniref:c-type cytochrome n=1 Tax=Ideonella sp. TaxID=1929293 RepID=UPI002B461F53|nr:c-type cytochrome [Ideonella sp.]HJV68516.1 c-type cytochrome [Ideonella sp.]